MYFMEKSVIMAQNNGEVYMPEQEETEMSKIICEICGTSYPETAESCPICGYSQDLGAAFLDDDFLMEEDLTETVATKETAGKFKNSRKKEIFDYDEVNPEEDDLDEEDYPDDEDDDEEDDDYEEEPRHNTFLVILLVVLIMVLLAVAGYIFLRYFMPNVFPEETVATTTAVEQAEQEASAGYEIPCTNLVLTSGEAKITAAGYYHLLNVIVQPEDTTDKLVFTSEDESIATVSEDGRITAVSEGTTNIYITCGSQQRICPVTCVFDAEETTAVEETGAVSETVPAETVEAVTVPAETEAEEETEATEATAASEVTAQVTLKLKDTDIRLGVGYGHTILLDCDLKHEDIEWRVEHEYLAKVDDKGFVTALANGTTAVIAKYGDQEVQCILRCYSLW